MGLSYTNGLMMRVSCGIKMNKIDAISSIPIMSVHSIDQAKYIANEIVMSNNNLVKIVEDLETIRNVESMPLKELIEFLWDNEIYYDENNVWRKL